MSHPGGPHSIHAATVAGVDSGVVTACVSYSIVVYRMTLLPCMAWEGKNGTSQSQSPPLLPLRGQIPQSLV